MSLRQTIFNWYRKRAPRHQATFPRLDRVQTVLLLFESDLTEKNLQVKQLAKELAKEGREVTAWGYVDMKRSQSAILRNYRVLSRSDINLFHKPKSTHLDDLKGQHFDLLIDLSLHQVLPLRYLALYANADFRAGAQTQEPYLSDFMLALPPDKDQVYLFDQIMYYLKNIQSND